MCAPSGERGSSSINLQNPSPHGKAMWALSGKGTQMTRYVFVSRCHLWQLLQRTISNAFCNILVSSAVLWPRRESKQNFDWSGTPDSNVAWRRDTSHPIKETRELRGTELLKDLVSSNNFDFTAAPPLRKHTAAGASNRQMPGVSRWMDKSCDTVFVSHL